MKNIVSAFLGLLLTGGIANANSSFSFNGRLLNQNGVGEQGSSTFSVLIKVGTCEVYRETHSPNMAGSSGYFSLPIGSGSGKIGNLEDVFSRGSIPCIGQQNPHVVDLALDKITISADVAVDGQHKIAIENQEIKAVPFAVNAEKLAGVDASKYAQKLQNVTDLKIKQLVDQLLDGTGISLVYTKSEVDAIVSGQVSAIDLSGKADVSLANVSSIPSSKLSGTIDVARIPSLATYYVTPAGLTTALSSYTQTSSLKPVATSGSYNDLTGKPVLGDLAAKSSINLSDIKSTSSGNPAAFAASACSANQSLSYSSLTDQFVCQSIGGDLNVGSLKASKAISGSIGNLVQGTPIDFAEANSYSGSHTCATPIVLSGLESGGVYTLVNTNTATTQCIFAAAGGLTFKFSPANAARTPSSTTVYSFLVVGTVVYVSWSTGF